MDAVDPGKKQTLREIEMILLHHVEHGLPGEPAMVLGKQLVHPCKFVIGHGTAPVGK